MPETVLGEKLKRLRKERGLTQEKLSEKLGFSKRYISKIEAGEKPSMEAFRKLAGFFQVPIEYLVSEAEDLNALSTVIHDRELLDAFVQVDQMESQDRKLILDVIQAVALKYRVKTIFRD